MPTTNPVPSTDPSDLLFNAGKLDEVVNGTANSFTDRLGVARRTVAGMNADFDAQLADAESDLNVYRADAAASAAEALGYLQTIRATSYGAYAEDPATDPLGNPPTVGDEYFNTTANLLKRWNGTTWQASDINTANLAAPSGSSMVGYDTGTVQDVLDGAKSLQDYAALRAYTGRATGIRITQRIKAGFFYRDNADTTSADNKITVIVDAAGRRWKRLYDGAVFANWHEDVDQSGVSLSVTGLQAVFNAFRRVELSPSSRYKINSTLTIPDYCAVYGDFYSTEINCENVVGPAIQLGPDGVMTNNATLRGVRITGTATKAVSLNNCVACSIEDIYAAGTFTDAFYFRYTYPGTFKNLYTNGASISNACFVFADEVNACTFDNLYTSNSTPLYNFYWSGTGHGNVFNNPTAQGAKYGMYIRYTGYFGGITINGLYTENVAKPLVIGGEESYTNPTAAFNIVVNGATLGGPSGSVHPHYSSTVAAIELNACDGVVLNGINFLGTYRTAGGYPTVSITGDGAGANAIARVAPDGTIHSVEILTLGSGYTTATAVISGGGGSGATLTATVSGGQVTGITVTAAGSGYKRLPTPMAIRYGAASNVKISGSKVDGVSGGINFPLYPFLCRNGNYTLSTHATIMIDDTSLRQGSIGCSAQVMKVGTNSAGPRFAVIECDMSGNRLAYVYLAPNFSM